MHFTLTGEQEAIRKMAQEFATGEIDPVADEIDESDEFPVDLMREMGKIGLLGMTVPPEYGGSGADTVSYALAVEEVSRFSGTMGIMMAAHNSLPLSHIYRFGSEEQKRKYIPPLAKGEAFGAWALTEPSAGSDAAGVRTTARLDGDSWVLNGLKHFITAGAVADTCVIIASTDRSLGHRGISAFIVEKGTKGFSYGKIEDKLGMRGSVTSELFFDDCRIPKENMLGKQNRGFYDTLAILDGGRVSIAALALGIARGAYEESLKYAKEREQFGRPIWKFQAIQWKLADMATEIDAARLMILRAAQLKDKGEKFTKEAAMAKLYASEVAMEATTQAIQIHGGYGYMKDYPVERMFRDAKLCEIGEGTSEILRGVISRQLGL